jgi:hypothetical protein
VELILPEFLTSDILPKWKKEDFLGFRAWGLEGRWKEAYGKEDSSSPTTSGSPSCNAYRVISSYLSCLFYKPLK